MLRTFLRWFAVTIVCVIGVPLTAGITILGSLIFLPLPATLPTPKANLVSLPSQVYDANGNLIATFQQFDQSIPVQEKDIPKVLKDALVASEDKNFYHEGGVDPRGTLRAFVRDLQGKGYLQGGSTITQQYVSLAYTGKQRTITRKLKEAILASQLARAVPKDQILYKYLSTVYLGDGTYGVGAAAASYFHLKNLQQMTVGQAALLVGLIPAPSRYEPRGNQVLAEVRRQTVLLKMFQQRYITLQQYQYWKVAQVYESSAPPLPAGAPETLVYAPQQQQTRYPYFVDYVRRYLELQPGIGPNLLYQGGLKIQTTLDPTLQAEAQASVSKTLDGTSEPLEMSLVSIEPQTGHVRALIGGRDFAQDQTNLALGGCQDESAYHVVIAATCQTSAVPQGGGTGRQPGSSFKPFVLATAFEHGLQPSYTIYGPGSIALPPGCKGSACAVIHNADPAEAGLYTLARGMWDSVNTVYAQLILNPAVGVQATADTAKRMGITSAWYSPQVHGASYALGALDVSPLDMASAYGVFDNHGVRVAPTPIIRVEDSNGKTLIDDSAPNTRRRASGVPGRRGRSLPGTVRHGRRQRYRCADRRADPARRDRLRQEHRTPGGRQDGHDLQLRRRLVRRVHAHAVDIGVDGEEEHRGRQQGRQPLQHRRGGDRLRRDAARSHMAGLHDAGDGQGSGHQLQPAATALGGRQCPRQRGPWRDQCGRPAISGRDRRGWSVRLRTVRACGGGAHHDGAAGDDHDLPAVPRGHDHEHHDAGGRRARGAGFRPRPLTGRPRPLTRRCSAGCAGARASGSGCPTRCSARACRWGTAGLSHTPRTAVLRTTRPRPESRRVSRSGTGSRPPGRRS